MTQASVAPWRRSSESTLSKKLSVDAPAFVPSLSVDAPEFVPSWAVEPMVTSVAQSNCCLISLGAYSDDSEDSSEDDRTPRAADPPAVLETPADTDNPSPAASRRPWRASAPEFAPRSDGTLDFISNKELDAEETRSEGRSGSSTPPWRHCVTTPSGKTEASFMTMSTSEGSGSPAASLDGASSHDAASCVSRSRSPSPEATKKDEVSDEDRADMQAVPAVLNLNAIMRWRSSTTEATEIPLPRARVPDQGTQAAAIASYVANLATGTSSPSRRKSSSTRDWRRASMSEKAEKDEESWRPKPGKLEVSDDSWAAKQSARRRSKSECAGPAHVEMDDEDVVRAMKSILNKLTVEKFESLSVQLIHCGISNETHLELLIQEVFEKATTQHHFIDMYADLCDLLNIHFTEHPFAWDPKKNFKKVLLHCCQASFERNLTPPQGLSSLSTEDRATAERKYKMRMLGNIKFVGALLVRKMLASKVMLAIAEELLGEPSPEALEALAALLTVVGPSFDTPEWPYITTLNALFKQIENISKKSTTHSRTRCLIKDVLDLRKSGWKDNRPKQITGPTKLEEVAAQAAIENGTVVNKVSDTWETVGKERMGRLTSILTSKASAQKQDAGERKVDVSSRKGSGAGAAMLAFLTNRDEEPRKERIPKQCKVVTPKEEVAKEILAAVSELRTSLDVHEAELRIAKLDIKAADQQSEIERLLTAVAEERTEAARKAGFSLFVNMILNRHWAAEYASKGVRSFVDICPDLKRDVPDLSKILRTELHPALSPLVQAGQLEASVRESVLKV